MYAFAVVFLLWAQAGPAVDVQRLLAEGKLAQAEAEIAGLLKTRGGDAQLWNLLGVVTAQGYVCRTAQGDSRGRGSPSARTGAPGKPPPTATLWVVAAPVAGSGREAR